MKSQRIAIVGTSGSGKSTLARRICLGTGYKDIELDALYWKPKWEGSTTEEFREKLLLEISLADQYVIHGNYRSVRDIVWKSVDTVIWLDYPRYLVMFRVLRRTITRVITREKLWGFNTETIRNSFFSKDSVILWAWSSYKKRKRDYESLTKDNPYQVKKIVRVRRPHEIRNIEKLLSVRGLG